MKIKRLSVQNVRIHSEKTLDFTQNPTLISGPNGCGKTSLMEAIYIALRGKSFRGGDETICKYGSDFYRIVLETDALNYRVQYGQVGMRKARQFIINDKKYARLPYKLKYPIVLFEPEELRIINGSPQRRRDFLDRLIQQYDPLFSQELGRYNRALLQRNKLLKNPQIRDEELFSWNLILSDYGAKIIEKRQNVLNEFDKKITAVYRDIAENSDEISLKYSHEKISAQKLLREYEEKIAYDKIIGATSIGPHRHDFLVNFNGNQAAKIASRGESRTIVLAMKFLEANYIQEKTGVLPLILLDDVFGELDENRRQRLLKEFTQNQIIMTSTD